MLSLRRASRGLDAHIQYIVLQYSTDSSTYLSLFNMNTAILFIIYLYFLYQTSEVPLIYRLTSSDRLGTYVLEIRYSGK